MDFDDVCSSIGGQLADMLSERGEECPPLAADTRLLGGELPIDSLDLAVLVIELERLTGRDPFQEGFIEFHTIGELGRLYAD